MQGCQEGVRSGASQRLRARFRQSRRELLGLNKAERMAIARQVIDSLGVR